MSHIDVQIPGKKCCRRVTCSALVRRRVIDLHQLSGDERIVRVRVLEITSQLWSRDQCVEHRGSGDRSVDSEPTGFAANSDRLVKSNETRGRNEGDSREAMRITGGEHDGVRARQ